MKRIDDPLLESSPEPEEHTLGPYRKRWGPPDPDLQSKAWVARAFVGASVAIAFVLTFALVYFLADLAPAERIAPLMLVARPVVVGLAVVGAAAVVTHYFRRPR